MCQGFSRLIYFFLLQRNELRDIIKILSTNKPVIIFRLWQYKKFVVKTNDFFQYYMLSELKTLHYNDKYEICEHLFLNKL